MSSRIVHAQAMLALGQVDAAAQQNEAALARLRELELPRIREADGLELRAGIHRARGELEAEQAARREWLGVLTEEFGSGSPRVVTARGRLD